MNRFLKILGGVVLLLLGIQFAVATVMVMVVAGFSPGGFTFFLLILPAAASIIMAVMLVRVAQE